MTLLIPLPPIAGPAPEMPADPLTTLSRIERLDRDLMRRFTGHVLVQPSLTRQLVSFQANKAQPLYRWYKYKEAFSASLVEHLFHRYHVAHGRVLDPFAGVGTTLFVAAGLGLGADGIELLPIGQQVIDARELARSRVTPDDLAALRRWRRECPWRHSADRLAVPELRITLGAYPPETRVALERYLGTIRRESKSVQSLLRFAALCVLEAVSFTRKDGQYLRWDHRSGRRQGKKLFDKGFIPSFDEAISAKLEEIVGDLGGSTQQLMLMPTADSRGEIQLLDGSCLDVLPTRPSERYDALMTSPPYCNRYDYTRTYALELALLGVSEHELAELRQRMLSCTVENRQKDLLATQPRWATAISAADCQELLQTILTYLDEQKDAGDLNNNGIPRMVRGYFYEMACVIQECARVLKPGAPFFMVNDNVRYAGASVSVDLILSEIAEKLGLMCEHILVLPNGKGNSSQQMGEHGRDPLRKCVYVWRKQ